MMFGDESAPVLGTACLLIILTFGFYKWKFSYWKRRNVPFLKPSIPFGNQSCPLTRKCHLGLTLRDIYFDAKNRGLDHLGLYFMTEPVYLPTNLQIIKQILTTNFEDFPHRGVFYNEKDDPLTAHLFALEKPKWKPIREKINKSFTPCKLKNMLQTLKKFQTSLKKLIEENCDEACNIKEIIGHFTIDTLGACALGLDFKTEQNNNSPIREFSKKLFTPSGRFEFLKKNWKILRRPIVTAYPNLARFFKIKLIEQEVSDFFINMIKDNVKYRRERQSGGYNDLLQTLMEVAGLTNEEIAAQCYIFLLAGFETSASIIAFALYEMAKNQDIQDKARREVVTVFGRQDEEITSDSLNNLKYMDLVIDETLRKYPPSPYLTRMCTNDVTIDDVTIEKNTQVVIPVLGVHYDHELHRDPERFDPERPSDEKKAFIAFGEGPRKCVGFKFGLLQIKVCLSCLLKNFKFTVNQKTQEPLKMKVNPTMLAVEGEIWLQVQRLDK